MSSEVRSPSTQRPAEHALDGAHDNHQVVCRRCGRTEDVNCAAAVRPCVDPSSTAGFVVDGAKIVFWGLCPDCSNTQPR